MNAELLKMLLKLACEDECQQAPARTEELKIVVLQRGYVVVGMMSQSGTTVTVTRGSFIRRWGTTRGLGELASGGPLENTKLDPCHGPLEVHERDVVFRLACNRESWGDRYAG